MELKNQLSKTPYLVLFIVLISMGAGSNLAFAEPLTLFHTTFVDSFSVEAQEITPFGFVFSSNGAKMFVTGTSPGEIHEYTLSTGFDVSTASIVDSFSVAAQEAAPFGLAFSSDGSKMFVTGQSAGVNEYTLTTPFDVSTATFVDSFSVEAQDTFPRDVVFSSGGLKMFVVGDFGDDVNEYTLSTPFDVSTATFVSSFSVFTQTGSPQGMAFSSDGTKMFVVGNVSGNGFSGGVVFMYDIKTYQTCSVPISGNFVVDSNCEVISNATVTGDLIIQNNSTLKIPAGVTLIVNGNVLVGSLNGIYIVSGGTLIITS